MKGTADRPRKRTEKRRNPEVLTKLIEYTAEQLLAIAALPPMDSSDNSMPRPMPDWFVRQLFERLDALHAHYNINKSGSGSLFLLLLAVAAERYPGFRFRRRGQSGRGRKLAWTLSDQIDLWIVMKTLIDNGHKVASAATEVRDKLPTMARGWSAETIEARFYDAEKTMQQIRRGEITDFECMELLIRSYGLRSRA